MFALFLLLFLLAFTLVWFFYMASSLVGFIMTRVPYVRTRSGDISEIVRNVPVSKEDLFFDLGSGDGKVVFAVEEESGARVRGYELTAWSHLLSRVKRRFKHSNAELLLGNFFKHDFSEATIIYCYLYPPLMKRLSQKMLSECTMGTKIVSRDFPIPDLKEASRWKSVTGHTIYLYQI
jgi:hypothetical protein